MKTSKFMLVTVIAEPILASKISLEMQQHGSTGITNTEVKGEGSKHLHSGEIPGDKMKMECVVDQVSAKKIMKHIAEKYFENYSVIVYAHEVEVVRYQKFKMDGKEG